MVIKKLAENRIAANQQYYCYQCNRIITITPTPASSEVLCPNCDGGFVEEIPNPNPSFSNPRSFSYSSDNHSSRFSAHGGSPLVFPTSLAADDQTEDTNIIGGTARNGGGGGGSGNTGIEMLTQMILLDGHRAPGAAAIWAIEALPHVTISEEMLGGDYTECVVCRDSFRIGEEAKQMPCKHIYHSDCIMPWLEMRNSCPVCRYKLPTDYPNYESLVRDGTRSSVGGFDDVAAAAVIAGGLQENVGAPRATEGSFSIQFPRQFRTSGDGSWVRDGSVGGFGAVDAAAVIAGGLQDNVGAPRAMERSFPRQFRTSGEGSDGRDGSRNCSCPVRRYEFPTDPEYESRVRDGSVREFDALLAACRGFQEIMEAPCAMESPIQFPRQLSTPGEGSDGRDGGSNSENDNVGGSNSSGEAKEENLE